MKKIARHFLLFVLLTSSKNIFGQVVINEVMFNPGTQGMLGTNDPTGWYYGSEYIEIYNNGCTPVDISGWMLANHVQPIAGSTRVGGSFSFPTGTIIQPKSHFVLGTRNSSADPNSIDFKTENYAPATTPPNTGFANPWNRYQNIAFPYLFQNGNPPARPCYWVLPNFEGWIALYNSAGVPQDALYWTGANDQNFITTAAGTPYFADRPTAPLSYTNADPTLPSARQIFQTNPSIISWFNRSVAVQNQTIQRVPDGGSWSASTGAPSINHNVNGPNANCNGGVGNCFTPPPATTGFSYTSPSCNTGTVNPTPVTGFTPGGTYTALPSVVIDANTGVIDLAASTPGGPYTITYTITANGCSSSGVGSTQITINVAPNAGTNGTATLCNNGTAVNLFSYLGGTPATTGTWSGPSALGGGNLGTFNPATMQAGTYTYTVAGAPCPNATATVAVTINDCTCPLITNPSPIQTLCAGDDPAVFSVSTSITGANTITYKYYNAIQTGNNMYTGGTILGNVTPASGSATYDAGILGTAGSLPNTAGTYYVYAILNPAPADPACRPFQQIIVNVTATNTVAPASATPTLCINTALPTAITHATTGATGIGTPSGLPTGVNATWAANTITINGTPSVAGTFTYSIPLTGGCGNVNATGTITVTADNTVGAASATPTLCINTALPTAITHATTGATGIGTPTGLPTGVNATWSANSITISGTPSVAGTFTYSIPLTGGCGNVNAAGTITVTANNTVGAASATPTLCINTALPAAITHTTTGATGIGTPSGLPTGVNATWAANTITISGTPSVAGPFTYSIPLTGGCGNIIATGTITVTAENTAAPASSTPSLCINTALPTAITHTTTGATGIGTPSGLPTGVNATWSANIITINGTPSVAGTFIYSIPLTGGCGNVNATGSITVVTSNTVGPASSTPTLCINTPLPAAITHTTSGATGILNNGISGANGLPAGVTATWSSNTITISGTPTAPGPFTYTIPLTGGCGATQNATGTITVNTDNTAGQASSSPTLCINTALPTAITHITTGATGIGTPSGLPTGVNATWSANTITISGIPSVAGTFAYSIPLTGGCGNVNAIGTITVTAENTAGQASSSPTLCINAALPTAITHTTTGATGIGTAAGLPAGVTANWSANTITISGTPTAAGTFNYTIPLTGGCGNVNATGTITVNTANTVGPASSTPSLCINTALPTPITHTTTGATGIGTPLGLPTGVSASWSSNTITISGIPTASGTFNYSIPLSGGCGTANAIGTITVAVANTASAPSSVPNQCINTPITGVSLNTTGATGIGNPIGLPVGVTATWTANVITISGTPKVAGTFNYSIPLLGGCGNVNALGTIIVNALPVVNAGPDLSINIGQSVQIQGSVSGIGVNILWSPSGTLLNATTAKPTAKPLVTTKYVINVLSAQGCSAKDSMTVFVFEPIDIPNAFSPNGDGFNDLWIIDKLEQYPNSIVEVFNRYGKKIFERKGYNRSNAWDGTNGGSPLPVAPYYYILRLGDGSKPRAGVISIIR